MFDSVVVHSPRPLSPLRALLSAAAVVAALDGIEAVLFFGARGVTPLRIFQHVAGGVLGPGTFDGGLASFGLGLLLHFTVALSISSVYFLASRWLPVLARRPVLCGMAYGVVAFFVMHFVVVPLSAAPLGGTRSAWPILLNGVLGHVFLVGLPIGLFASRVKRPEPSPSRSQPEPEPSPGLPARP
jgi:hypothetical protein